MMAASISSKVLEPEITHLPLANRDLKGLMEIIDSIKELTEDDEV